MKLLSTPRVNEVTLVGLDQVADARKMGNEKHSSGTRAWIRPSDTPHTRAIRACWRRLERTGVGGGGTLASRGESHTGTKEVVYTDKTHTEMPSFHCAPPGYVCVQRDYGLVRREERDNRRGDACWPDLTEHLREGCGLVSFLDVYAATMERLASEVAQKAAARSSTYWGSQEQSMLAKRPNIGNDPTR